MVIPVLQMRTRRLRQSLSLLACGDRTSWSWVSHSQWVTLAESCCEARSRGGGGPRTQARAGRTGLIVGPRGVPDIL